MSQIEYKNVGMAIERYTHFASDHIHFFLIISNEGQEHKIQITLSQFDYLSKNGMPAYKNVTTMEGTKIELL